ncbi:MAG TPA: glycoside hydrolase family 3 protein [Nocardioidaceae bacterium]|nr:glycoside hydrolase family 3 protein [Nocardioidaceae bacterium]
MTDLDRLAASVLLPGFDGSAVPGWLASWLDAGLAGVCLFGHNVVDDDQIRTLTDSLHGHGSHVIVASDEEGGTVSRLDRRDGSPWPGHATLGALDDVEATRAVAAGMATRLRALGVDLALAPVVDVNSEPDNPVIGVRSFGATPDLVGRHGAAFVRGLQSAGVAACVKHFPGHGATRTDSHLTLPVLDVSPEVLLSRDIPPFEAAVRANVACVMTAHVVVPSLDQSPATTSHTLLGLLREDLGFKGVVVTDALDMRAVSDGAGRCDAAVRALVAGADLLCVGNPVYPDPYDDAAAVTELVEKITLAVRTGRLPRERLEEASGRVGALARRAHHSRTRAPQPAAHGPELGRDVAARALRATGDVRVGDELVVVVPETEVAMAAGRRESALVRVLARRRPSSRVVRLDSTGSAAEVTSNPAAGDLLVVLDGRPTVEAATALDALLAARPDTVVVDASVREGAWSARGLVRTFGGGLAVAEAVADLVLEGDAR